MDSFEQVVASILERRGYWARTSVKVDLETADKREIGRPSSPRWELDVVGYRGCDNSVLVLECKSFLDSPGVRSDTFAGKNAKDARKYKLFFEDTLRRVVLDRLARQLTDQGLCPTIPSVRLGLAAGKIYGNEQALVRQFNDRGWDLWTPATIRVGLLALKDSKYENSVAAVVAKVLLRGSMDGPTQEDDVDEENE
jgi:hypothetical protein